MSGSGRTHTKKVNGLTVEQIPYGDNWYTPVDERIRIANYADPKDVKSQIGYTVAEYSIIPVADRWAYTCRIEYPKGSGCYYPGSDFIDTKTKDGLAKAETSAIGRALGMAGIANEGGIASAEEMAAVESAPPPAPQQKTPQQPHSLRLKRPTHGTTPPARPPFVTLEQCADFAEDHGIDRDAYQRAIAKYGTDRPEYLLAALEVYADKMEEKARAAR